jgi:hypothetical protein
VSLPLIGITGWRSQPFGSLARYTFNLTESYVRAVQAAGGLPGLPPVLKENELHSFRAARRTGAFRRR